MNKTGWSIFAGVVLACGVCGFWNPDGLGLRPLMADDRVAAPERAAAPERDDKDRDDKDREAEHRDRRGDRGSDHRRDVDDQDRQAAERRETRRQAACDEYMGLDRTVRLKFELVGTENPPTLHVLTVAGDFEIHQEVMDAGAQRQIHVAGEMAHFDDQGQVLLHYELKLHQEDPAKKVGADYQTRGSTVLEMGVTSKLAVFGETPVQVTANWEE